jgi:hypothetical protein
VCTGDVVVSKRDKKKNGPVVWPHVPGSSESLAAVDRLMQGFIGEDLRRAHPQVVVDLLTECPRIALNYEGQDAPWLEEVLARVRASYSTDEERAAFDAWTVRCRENARYLREIAHWDAWGAFGVHHINRPERNCKPEAAVKLLLEKARSMFGEQDWSAWEWRAHEYGVQFKRVIRLNWHDAAGVISRNGVPPDRRKAVSYLVRDPLTLERIPEWKIRSRANRAPNRRGCQASWVEPGLPPLLRTPRVVALLPAHGRG